MPAGSEDHLKNVSTGVTKMGTTEAMISFIMAIGMLWGGLYIAHEVGGIVGQKAQKFSDLGMRYGFAPFRAAGRKVAGMGLAAGGAAAGWVGEKVTNLRYKAANLTGLQTFLPAEEKKRAKERERIERQNMTNEQLQAYIDHTIDEIDAKWQREIEKKEAEFKEYKRKNRLLDAISQVENAPPELMKIVTINWPDDDEKVKEIIQDISDKYNARLESHKFVIDNKRRASTPPRSGDKKISYTVSDKELSKMSEREQRSHIDNMNLDEIKKQIFDEVEK